MLDQLPKPFVVFFAICLGLVAIVLLQEPQTVCHSQVEQAKSNLQGQLFPKPGKKMALPAKYPRALENCKFGNSQGACFEYFSVLKRVIQEYKTLSNECAGDFSQIPEVRRALVEGLKFLTILAWGEQPPETENAKQGWLESPDLALFCQLRGLYLSSYGPESFAEFRNNLLNSLPGEARLYSSEPCEECPEPKKAIDLMSFNEVTSKSLLSVNCEAYR
jgi:hypothetical protein